ncbi:hemopexin repeat-containing protein [Mariniphaga sp.]|uniref:hemopexin repeat-containing protein n=1 Tax=Mariniphaga sp. TaxID=1954475 RepID=UPI0035682955
MPEKNVLSTGPMEGELVVIFKPGAEITATKKTVRSSKRLNVSSLNKTLKQFKVEISPVFHPKRSVASMSRTMKAELKKSAVIPQTIFSLHSTQNIETLRQEFLRDSKVEAAYIKPFAEDPSINWGSPDFSGNQGYLDAAPGGVDARFAWNLVGGKGDAVSITDVEQGFNFSHEDLRTKISGLIGGNNVFTSQNHGTAVLGVLGAAENSFGMTGISPQSKIVAISHNGLGTSQAIINAADKCKAGDIILLEVHRPGPSYDFKAPAGQRGFIAIEWWPDDFAAIRYAVLKGILVVEAAGNGTEDFDKEIYNQRPSGFPSGWKNPFNPANPQSGAVIVGAGASPSSADRTILGFSNWGRRVDAQGWGHNVATLGYGGAQNDKYVSINPNNNWTVESGFPKNLSDIGPGMKSGIDAALWSETNNKVYYFRGSEYYRVDPNNGWAIDGDYPKDIKGNWPGFPDSFTKKIDAALWSNTNNKIYFFKGNQFIRVDPNNAWKVDPGYPKPIAGNWPGFPASFAKGVDAAIYSFKNNRIYFFRNNRYIRVNPANTWKVDPGYPKLISSNWRNLPLVFRRGIDAAIYDKTNDKVYFVKSHDILYTNGFSGTSSASPVVTGALACIQGRLKARGKPLLTATSAQNLLRSTGSPQLRLSGAQEQNKISNWKGLNATFGSGIDAALWNGKSNTIYFFKGNQYVRINPTNNWNIDPTYPKPIEGNWPGFPDSFNNGVDAALWSDPNKKVYFFKGNQFIRVDPFNGWNVDPGYPKSISGSWPGFPASFASGVDGALWSHTNKKIYFFKGNQFIRVDPDNNWQVDAGYPKSITPSWPGFPSDFASGIDAAVWSGTNSKIYFFKGEKYIRSDPGNSWKVDPGYPNIIAHQRIGNRPNLKQVFQNLDIASNWPGFPQSFGQGVDAALWSETNKKVYFFKNNQFIRVDPFNNWEMDAGYPKTISSSWPGFPSSFATGVNAALWSDPNKKIYFFKGNQFIRVDPNNGWKVDQGYPKTIASSWPGFPSSFANGVDAALWSGTNNRIYFFKGNKYIRVNPSNGWKVDPGYPNFINGNWRGIPASFKSGLSAVLWNGKSKNVYFFKNSQYLKIIPSNNWTMEPGYPRGIIV